MKLHPKRQEDLGEPQFGSYSLFDKPIWRITDLAVVLACSKGHIYNLVSRREIPYCKKGKFLFFIPNEILNWIQEGN